MSKGMGFSMGMEEVNHANWKGKLIPIDNCNVT